MKNQKNLKLNNYVISQHICQFIDYYYQNNETTILYGYNEFKNKLLIAKHNFKLNSAQILALCFQNLIWSPFENVNNYKDNSKILKDLYKNIKKNNIHVNEKESPFIIFPDRTLTPLNIRKTINLIKSLKLTESINDHVDAKQLWDINHYYYSLEYQEFLFYMQAEYDSINSLLTEEEFFSIKLNQFSELLSQKNIYKSGVFKKKFDYKAKVNLKKFVSNIKISKPIKYNA